MTVRSAAVLVPYNSEIQIRPKVGDEWKVTAVVVKGPSLRLAFAHWDPSSNQTLSSDPVMSNAAEFRTELYITNSDFIVFKNDSSGSNFYAFFSAIDVV